jgi:hypothetical protein
MNIKEKTYKNKRVVLEFDEEHFSEFIRNTINEGKELEYKSDSDKHTRIVVINTITKPFMPCKGYVSRTGDLFHVLFLDYDNILWWLVEEELNLLIKKYDLSPFYVFKTHEEIKNDGELSGNYMAVCLTKRPFAEINDIQRVTHTDEAHRIVSKNHAYKSSVLRLSGKGSRGKPEFKCIVGDTNKDYNQDISSAHLNAIKELYDIPEVKYNHPDGLDKLWTIEYITSSE